MDDVTTWTKLRLSPAEQEWRRKIVRRADAENRLEGAVRRPESDAIFNAFINGEIEATDIVPRLKSLRRHE